MELKEEILIEDDNDILDIIDFGFPRRVNIRPNYFQDMDDLGFVRRFRLTKDTTLYLLGLIEDQLELENNLYVTFYDYKKCPYKISYSF